MTLPENAPDVVALFGPTGLGKTAVAVELARILRERGDDPMAVSVDSMQVYRELPIVTGAPNAEQRAQLEHRLVGVISVTQEHDVVTHARMAHEEVDAARAAGRRAIVVGGTGLYLRAALTELDFLPPPAPGRREELEERAAREGTAALYAELEARDPVTAASLDPANQRRVIRAIEAVERGGRPAARDENRLWTREVRVPTRLFSLELDREVLYERIEARVDEMVLVGAVEEVRAADALGMSRTARQALGVEELLAGDVDALKINTRRYAKRQLTWLRKLAGATRVDLTGREPATVAAEIAAAAVEPATG